MIPPLIHQQILVPWAAMPSYREDWIAILRSGMSTVVYHVLLPECYIAWFETHGKSNTFSTFIHLNLDSLNKPYDCYFNEVMISFIFHLSFSESYPHFYFYFSCFTKEESCMHAITKWTSMSCGLGWRQRNKQNGCMKVMFCNKF